MSHTINENLADDLRIFLEEHGKNPTNIKRDKDGAYIEIEDDSTGETDGDVEVKKIYLPANLQEIV